MGSDEQILCSNDIFEILTRISSLKTLDTIKCVSKNWNKLAYESTFMPLNSKMTNNLSGYFIQVRNNFNKFPIDMRILASCNQGLLCCVRKIFRADRLYVCKPATWQWQALPNPKLRYFTISVAIMVLGSTPLCYKIVRLSHDQRYKIDPQKVRCEIFDSKSWRWRATTIPALSYREIGKPSHPVVCVGSINWLLKHNDNYVLIFHEANESFGKFRLPDELVKGVEEKSRQLVSYQGRLGLMCRRGSDMELWIVEDYNTYKWTKVRSLSTSSLESTFHESAVRKGFYNAGTAFFKTWGEVVFYRLDDGRVRKVELSSEMAGKCDDFFQFRSDLEPVDLGGGRGTRGSIGLC